jgi:hypothetical protein
VKAARSLESAGTTYPGRSVTFNNTGKSGLFVEAVNILAIWIKETVHNGVDDEIPFLQTLKVTTYVFGIQTTCCVCFVTMYTYHMQINTVHFKV